MNEKLNSAINKYESRLKADEVNKSYIGTLGEKTLHGVLKEYLAEEDDRQEVKIGSFYADIVGKNGITEIQTRNFGKLRKKLEAFLKDYEVTVVYPVAKVKWLCWLDMQTGEITKKRKSPKIGREYEIFKELIYILDELKSERLHIKILFLELTETRMLDGWSRDKKKGSTRFDRMPNDILGEVNINSTEDYVKLFPKELPEEFTSNDFSRATGLSDRFTNGALKILMQTEIIKRIGKNGRTYLYKRFSEENK